MLPKCDPWVPCRWKSGITRSMPGTRRTLISVLILTASSLILTCYQLQGRMLACPTKAPQTKIQRIGVFRAQLHVRSIILHSFSAFPLTSASFLTAICDYGWFGQHSRLFMRGRWRFLCISLLIRLGRNVHQLLS